MDTVWHVHILGFTQSLLFANSIPTVGDVFDHCPKLPFRALLHEVALSSPTHWEVWAATETWLKSDSTWSHFLCSSVFVIP
jgi:hypothetical protein